MTVVREGSCHKKFSEKRSRQGGFSSMYFKASSFFLTFLHQLKSRQWCEKKSWQVVLIDGKEMPMTNLCLQNNIWIIPTADTNTTPLMKVCVHFNLRNPQPVTQTLLRINLVFYQGFLLPIVFSGKTSVIIRC